MKLEVCALCGKMKFLPFHITEISDNEVTALKMCVLCAEVYLAKPQEIVVARDLDLSKIKSPQDLIDIIVGTTGVTCENCGLTELEFEKSGKFGCPQCYDCFEDRMEKQIYPYHGACHHTGKIPKAHYQRQQESKEEQIKILKLRFAKALELEDYENAAVLKKQLDDLIS